MRAVVAHAGGSARALSVKAGLSDTHVGQLARGRIGKRPADQTLRAIARAAGISAHWLATGEGAMLDADGTYSAPDEPPMFFQLPGWPELAAAARDLDPAIPAWALDTLARSRPILSLPVTPSVVAELARIVMRHVAPPPSR